MKIIINGQPLEVEAVALDGAILELGLADQRVAVAKNGEFVPQDNWATTTLKAGDALEVLALCRGMRQMFSFYGEEIKSRLLLGTALYPSPQIMADAVRASGTEIVTVSLRREGAQPGAGASFWSLIEGLGVRVLPNTAGCHTVKEAVTTAKMAREVFKTDWIKLELIADNDTLCPDVVALVEAARVLTDEGFKVFPLLYRRFVGGGAVAARGGVRC